jgi:citrate lyase subunit beta/citryl-CoA lyase
MPPPSLHAKEKGILNMRSLLFVPGDSPRKLEKAMLCGADALIIDLEDSVAVPAKDSARQATSKFLVDAMSEKKRPRLFVRVNGISTGLIDSDINGIMESAPDGIVLPKAVGLRDVSALEHQLDLREAALGLPLGSTRIIAIATENALGVLAMGSFVGGSPRLAGLAWGGEDLSADIGAETNRTEDGSYTDPYRLARILVLLGATAVQVDAIDAVYTNIPDLDGLAAECREAQRDGFVAKMAIHPSQVPIINAAFTPSEMALARARAVQDLFERNPGAGVLSLNGEMLDRPHLSRAQRVLRRASQPDDATSTDMRKKT